MALFTFVCSAGVGITYMLPVKNAWLFYPKKKGMVSGIILSCYSFGAIIWSFFTTYLVNPNNTLPSLVIMNGKNRDLLFSEDSDVVANVPHMLRVLSYAYFGIVILAVLCISKKETERIDRIREPLICNSTLD